MTRVLRALAVTVALAGVVDPHVAVARLQPHRVDFRVEQTALAIATRDRLIRDLGNGFVIDTSERPDAVVQIGAMQTSSILPADVPVSFVSPVPAGSRNVRLAMAVDPEAVLVGQEAVFSAEFEAVGMKGLSSTIELQQDGVQLAAVEHRWMADREQFLAKLRYTPPVAGLFRVAVRAKPADGEVSGEDNGADLALLASTRTLRVAVYEPRPSWAAGFVRRALESDAVFSVSSVVRPSLGPEVSVGPRLHRLSPEALASFDAIVIGAPEELTPAEVSALTAFCETRGGAVVLLPDRHPSGAYAHLVTSAGFDDVLVDKPVALTGEGPIGVSASEFAVPRGLGPGALALASLHQGGDRVVIVSLPRGRGRVVFSGALDAWRFRAAGAAADLFVRFWTGLVANLALSSPPRVSVVVRPAVAGPGDRLRVRVEADPVALAASYGTSREASASLTAADGTEHFVRLWPSAAPGVLEGDVDAPPVGSYDARATVADATADTPIIVAEGVRHPPVYDNEAVRLVARASGGVVVDASDTTPLRRHLLEGSRGTESSPWRPMRSAWLIVPFTGVLCLEWALRRSRGLR